MVRIKQLHYFMGLAKHRSYRAGARALGISQSVLSQQISDLETQVGVQLFTRVGHVVTLTQAGEALFARLPEVFALLYETAALAQSWNKQAVIQNILRLGYERPFPPRSISSYLRRFKKTHNNVRCLIRQYSVKELSAALGSGELDAAFFLAPSSAPAGCAFQIIKTDTLAVVLRRELLRGRDGGDISSLLADFPLYCLGRESGVTKAGFCLCCGAGVVPEYLVCQSIDEIIRNVEAGSGLTLLPEECSADLYDDAQLASLPLSGRSASSLCWCVAYQPEHLTPQLSALLQLFPQAEPDCSSCPHRRECSVRVDRPAGL